MIDRSTGKATKLSEDTLGRSDFSPSRKDASTSFKRAGTPRDNQSKGWSRYYVFVRNFLKVGSVGDRVAEVLDFHLEYMIIFVSFVILNTLCTVDNDSFLIIIRVHTATDTIFCTSAKIRNLIFCIQGTRAILKVELDVKYERSPFN